MRTLRFTFLCTEEERGLIVALAKTMKRSQSDALRWLVRETAKELQIEAESLKDEMFKPLIKGDEHEAK